MPDRKPCSWNGFYYLNYYVLCFFVWMDLFLICIHARRECRGAINKQISDAISANSNLFSYIG